MKIFKSSMYSVLFIIVLVLSIGVGQFSQAMHSKSDMRQHMLIKWADSDSDRLAKIDQFTTECLIGGPIKNDGKIRPVVGIHECANAKGYQNLSLIIKNSDASMHSYAWPLSMIAD